MYWEFDFNNWVFMVLLIIVFMIQFFQLGRSTRDIVIAIIFPYFFDSVILSI